MEEKAHFASLKEAKVLSQLNGKFIYLFFEKEKGMGERGGVFVACPPFDP